jgi:Icc-related predicted phosphoesterase
MKGILAKLANKLEHMKNVVEKKEMESQEEEEEEVSEIVKPFFKALKALGGRPTELPMFTGKMDAELVLKWIEALENHFECEKTLELQ